MSSTSNNNTCNGPRRSSRKTVRKRLDSFCYETATSTAFDPPSSKRKKVQRKVLQCDGEVFQRTNDASAVTPTSEEKSAENILHKETGREELHRLPSGVTVTTHHLKEIRKKQEERDKRNENFIMSLDIDEMREILKKICSRQPALVADLLQKENTAPPEESRDATRPDFCVCSNCVEMEGPNAEYQNVCCRKQPSECLSRNLMMDTVVLDEATLAVARCMRNDLRNLDALGEEDINRANRHQSYRQYIYWQHGLLGRGVRRVIPCCVVIRIRNKFPSRTNTYTGFDPNAHL